MSKKRKKKPANEGPKAPTAPVAAPTPGTSPSESPPTHESVKNVASDAAVSAPNTSHQLIDQPQNSLARYVSFGLLLAVIAGVLFVFYEVMAKFLVSLFLAALLVVVFRPLHGWVLDKCRGRQKVAAMLTTAAVLLVVLIPLSALFLIAAAEGRDAIKHFNSSKVVEGVQTIRSNFGLDMPAASQIRDIDTRLLGLNRTSVLDEAELERHRTSLYAIEESAESLAKETQQWWPDNVDATSSQETDDEPDLLSSEPSNSGETNADVDSKIDETQPDTGNRADNDNVADADNDTDADNGEKEETAWVLFVKSLKDARQLHFKTPLAGTRNETETDYDHRMEKTQEYRQHLNKATVQFSKFKSELLGGRARAWVTEMVNPSVNQIDAYSNQTIDLLRDRLLKLGGGAASVIGNTLLSFAIMVIGLYFFLLDGPKMIQAFKGLSPLDDDHEQELVSEFGKVSRAVVVATLLSALVQGLLAGIGFYFAGLDSIFLLTVMSAVLAMVPFVGAAAVWVPCCLYLYLFDNNMAAAIGLAAYGIVFISGADNVIKPLVLHGQSNLHPLLALLSVLGGVATLGPIGILVGPMIVAFLQTLLKILQREMQEMGMDSNEPEIPGDVGGL